jgi:hypothetical protein
MGAISIILNLITLVFVVLLLLKDKTVLPFNIDKKLTLSASQVLNNMLSDDNAAASNRAEQPVDKNGSTGDFTNFDIVDYEIGKHVVTYNLEDLLGKVDKKSVTV